MISMACGFHRFCASISCNKIIIPYFDIGGEVFEVDIFKHLISLISFPERVSSI